MAMKSKQTINHFFITLYTGFLGMVQSAEA